MEQQRGAGIGGEFLALAAALVGIKDDPLGTMSLEQDDPDRRPPLGVRCRQRHRLGIVRFARPRLGEPLVEQLKGVGRHLASALGLASRLPQPIWSAVNDCGMGATWHSTSTSAWG